MRLDDWLGCALCSVLCIDTDGWVEGLPAQKLIPLITRGSLLEQMEEEMTDLTGNLLTIVHLEKVTVKYNQPIEQPLAVISHYSAAFAVYGVHTCMLL